MADPLSPSAGLEHIELVRGGAEAYARNSKSCLSRLHDIWEDIELPQSQQVAVLEGVITRAHAVWEEAVAAAEATQQRLRAEVEAALREVAAIRAELGAADKGEEAQPQGSSSQHRTLSAWRSEVEEQVGQWRTRRAQRLAEHEKRTTALGHALAQIGQARLTSPAAPDLTPAGMEMLALELARLQAERERRKARLGELVQTLRALCGEVGEDPEAALAEAHPSLACMWDSTARRVLEDVYRLAGAAGGAMQADLSDATLGALQSKADAITRLKAQREAHAAELMSCLNEMWEACGVPADTPERAALARLMGGTLRLHARSLERCMAEVQRCEEAKVAKMLEIVNGKARELIALCSSTHVAPPAGLDACVAAINQPEGRTPGAAADLLTKLLRMLSEVQVVAAKRAVIVAAIRELQEAADEDAWLQEFENDEGRYKGRDANKKLQRALRAQKLRERLPALAAAVCEALTEWRDAEASEFVYDGAEYGPKLEVLEGRIAAAAQEKAAKSQARRQSSGGTPGPSGPVSRTPLPKGMAGRELQQRHSIAIVSAAGATGKEQARAMRASGAVSLRPAQASGGHPITPPRAPQRTPKPAARSGGVGSSPQPAGAARAAAVAIDAAAPATPTSEKLIGIFNRAPLGQGPASELRRAASSGCDAVATTPEAHGPGAGAGDQDCAAGRGAPALGDDRGDDLSAMFDRLVAQTGGGAAKAAGSPSPAKQQTSSAVHSAS